MCRGKVIPGFVLSILAHRDLKLFRGVGDREYPRNLRGVDRQRYRRTLDTEGSFFFTADWYNHYITFSHSHNITYESFLARAKNVLTIS